MATPFVAKPMAFYRRIDVYTRIGGDIIESLQWDNMTLDFTVRWEWYFKYRSALLQIKYPKYRVEFKCWTAEPKGKTKNEIDAMIQKKRITTCKRMITKLSNSVEEYENEQRSTLLPDFSNQHYIDAKAKIIAYKEELINLTHTE